MKIAVVGATGLVGRVMLKLLEERNFPLEDLIPVAFTKWAQSSSQKKIKELTKAAQDLSSLYDAESRV